MVILCLISFAILLVAWIVPPASRNRAVASREATLERAAPDGLIVVAVVSCKLST